MAASFVEAWVGYTQPKNESTIRKLSQSAGGGDGGHGIARVDIGNTGGEGQFLGGSKQISSRGKRLASEQFWQPERFGA